VAAEGADFNVLGRALKGPTTTSGVFPFVGASFRARPSALPAETAPDRFNDPFAGPVGPAYKEIAGLEEF